MPTLPEPTVGDTSWFVNDRFGMFIHWGLYALPARHEWVKSRERIDDPATWPDVRSTAHEVRPSLSRARLGLFAGSADGDGETTDEILVGLPERPAFGQPRRRSVLVRELAQVRSVVDRTDDIALAAWDFPDLESAADEVRRPSSFGEPARAGVEHWPGEGRRSSRAARAE